jgi:hypothetical protein
MWLRPGSAALVFALAFVFVPGVSRLLRGGQWIGPLICGAGYVALVVWAWHLVQLADAQTKAGMFGAFTSAVVYQIYPALILVGLVLGWKQVRSHR